MCVFAKVTQASSFVHLGYFVSAGPAPPRFCSRRVIAGWVLAFIIVIIVIAIVHATRDGGSTTNYVTEEMRTNSQKIIDYALSAAQQGFVWKRLAHMCDVYGPRLSGTPALEVCVREGETKREGG